jgi:hypothetical protein
MNAKGRFLKQLSVERYLAVHQHLSRLRARGLLKNNKNCKRNVREENEILFSV